MAFKDLDADAKKIETLSELDAKVLLVRICTSLQRTSQKEEWSDTAEEIYSLVDGMLPGGAS